MMAPAAGQLLGVIAQRREPVGTLVGKLLPQRQAVLPEVEQRAQLAQGAVDGQRLCRLGRTQPRA